jgi:hypothetical protein
LFLNVGQYVTERRTKKVTYCFLHAKVTPSRQKNRSANEVEILLSRSSQSPDLFPTPEPTYMSSLWDGRVYEILEKNENLIRKKLEV